VARWGKNAAGRWLQLVKNRELAGDHAAGIFLTARGDWVSGHDFWGSVLADKVADF
jgi:hypothetical protein